MTVSIKTRISMKCNYSTFGGAMVASRRPLPSKSHVGDKWYFDPSKLKDKIDPFYFRSHDGQPHTLTAQAMAEW
jgi:hypothetical protein